MTPAQVESGAHAPGTRRPQTGCPSSIGRTWLLAILAAAGLAFALGLFVDAKGAWSGLLMATVLLAGLGLGGAVFVALHYVTGARWSTGIRRVPEAMIAVLPYAAVGGLALVLGARWLYPWADAAVVAGSHVLEGRAGWMNVGMFAVRTLVAFAAWTALGFLLVRRSRACDVDGDPRHRAKNVATSALFLAVFAVMFSALSFDWLVSLDEHWFSTIFSIYGFAGLFLSALAVIAILVVVLRRRGPLAHAATDDVLHDLGKLLFGFSLFWGYIWFSQYMLIWYANNPEETSYYRYRHEGAWAVLAAANVLLNWAIPFTMLLPRGSKRSETTLVRAAVIVLVGRWLDLYLAVAPAIDGATPRLLAFHVFVPAGAVAVFLLVFWKALSKAPAVPLGEPLAADAHAGAEHA